MSRSAEWDRNRPAREAQLAVVIAASRKSRKSSAKLPSLLSKRNDAEPVERENFWKAQRLLNRLTSEKDNDT